jgi:hypothetical protein
MAKRLNTTHKLAAPVVWINVRRDKVNRLFKSDPSLMLVLAGLHKWLTARGTKQAAGVTPCIILVYGMK